VLIAMLRRICVALGNSAGSPTTPGLRTKPAVRMHQSAISNEEFIAQFRDWLLQWKPTLAEIEYEVSYLSKLAEFMAPVPLAKVTKAVLRDFRLEERRRLQPGESCVKILRAGDQHRCVSCRDTKEEENEVTAKARTLRVSIRCSCSFPGHGQFF
jgi:hypothetical protein